MDDLSAIIEDQKRPDVKLWTLVYSITTTFLQSTSLL